MIMNFQEMNLLFKRVNLEENKYMKLKMLEAIEKHLELVVGKMESPSQPEQALEKSLSRQSRFPNESNDKVDVNTIANGITLIERDKLSKKKTKVGILSGEIYVPNVLGSDSLSEICEKDQESWSKEEETLDVGEGEKEEQLTFDIELGL
jgi:hypothetical protein